MMPRFWGFVGMGRKVVARVRDVVYVQMADAKRPFRGAPVCSFAEWQAGFRPKRMGELSDSWNPWPLFDDSQRVEVVEGGGWPFWGPADGTLFEDVSAIDRSYVPVHGLEAA